MSFADQKPFIVTFADLKRPWAGKRDGSRFRCYLCLKKFEEGDTARFVLNAYGNFFTCAECDGDDVKERYTTIMRAFLDRYNALGYGDS